MDRSAAAARFAELPLPSTNDEHWRFTDLRDFDPESFEIAPINADLVKLANAWARTRRRRPRID